VVTQPLSLTGSVTAMRVVPASRSPDRGGGAQ